MRMPSVRLDLSQVEAEGLWLYLNNILPMPPDPLRAGLEAAIEKLGYAMKECGLDVDVLLDA